MPQDGKPTRGMVDLGTFGGSSSSAPPVNASGHVVGDSSTTGDAAQHAFSWTATGGMVDLDTFGGGSSYASAVNGLPSRSRSFSGTTALRAVGFCGGRL